MASPFDVTYHPRPAVAEVYGGLYQKYLRLGKFVESQAKDQPFFVMEKLG
jgi:hypothetical protein